MNLNRIYNRDLSFNLFFHPIRKIGHCGNAPHFHCAVYRANYPIDYFSLHWNLLIEFICAKPDWLSAAVSHGVCTECWTGITISLLFPLLLLKCRCLGLFQRVLDCSFQRIRLMTSSSITHVTSAISFDANNLFMTVWLFLLFHISWAVKQKQVQQG